MFFKPLNTDFYKNNESKNQLSSILPWGIMAADGVVLIKGGALCCTYEFTAPDIGSSSMSKIAAISRSFNNSIVQLGEGWTVQFELQRRLSNEYPGSEFKSLTGFLIDKQRELNFAYQKAHYENHYFLTFTYKLKSESSLKGKRLFMQKKDQKTESESELIKDEIRRFDMTVEKVASIVRVYMHIERLDSNALATYLHSTVSLDWHKLKLPQDYAIFLDRILTSEDLHNSILTMMDELVQAVGSDIIYND